MVIGKEKFALWITPEAKKEVEAHYKQDNCKSQSEAKDVTADSIYRQKLILTPGKRLKDMVKSAGITRISTNGEEIATSGGNNGGSGNGGEEENPLG